MQFLKRLTEYVPVTVSLSLVLRCCALWYHALPNVVLYLLRLRVTWKFSVCLLWLTLCQCSGCSKASRGPSLSNLEIAIRLPPVWVSQTIREGVCKWSSLVSFAVVQFCKLTAQFFRLKCAWRRTRKTVWRSALTVLCLPTYCASVTSLDVVHRTVYQYHTSSLTAHRLVLIGNTLRLFCSPCHSRARNTSFWTVWSALVVAVVAYNSLQLAHFLLHANAPPATDRCRLLYSPNAGAATVRSVKLVLMKLQWLAVGCCIMRMTDANCRPVFDTTAGCASRCICSSSSRHRDAVWAARRTSSHSR